MPRRKSTHVDDPAAVGVRLREARERAGLTQRQLAFPGCSPAYISRIESGDRIPSLQLLRELGRRLDVSEDFLATGDDRLATEDSRLLEAAVSLRLDDLEQAEELLDAVLEAPWSKSDRARALAGLGELAFRRGDTVRAIQLIEQALGVWGAQPSEHPSLADTLGRAYAMQGRLADSVAVFRSSLAAAESRKDVIEQVRFGVLLANALIDSNDFDSAAGVLAETTSLSEATRDPLLMARLFWSQSRLHAMRSDTTRAAQYARRALEIVELTEHDYYVARAHELLAHIELDRERPEEALRLLERGWPLLESGNDVEKASFRLEEARALAQLGRREQAAALAMEVAGLLQSAQPKEAGRSYTLLAEIYASIDDTPRAQELFELATELLEQYPGPYLVRACSGLAEVLEAQGKPQEALAALKRALAQPTV